MIWIATWARPDRPYHLRYPRAYNTCNISVAPRMCYHPSLPIPLFSQPVTAQAVGCGEDAGCIRDEEARGLPMSSQRSQQPPFQKAPVTNPITNLHQASRRWGPSS